MMHISASGIEFGLVTKLFKVKVDITAFLVMSIGNSPLYC